MSSYVHVDLLHGVGVVGGHCNCMSLFSGLLLGGSNPEKWDDYQKKKFFINNSLKSIKV